MNVFGNEYGLFGKDDVRRNKIANVIKSGKVRSIDEISTYLQESSCIRRGHFFGYGGSISDFASTTILIGLCCERGGPSLSVYPSIEAADSISRSKGCRVRAIIPSYEFSVLGIYTPSEVNEISRRTRKVLDQYDFDVVDTLDGEYKAKRLDAAFRIQRFIGKEFRDPVGDDCVGLQLASVEIADILLSMQEGSTLLIADQGSALPALRARKIAEKMEIKGELGCLFYTEPLDTSGRGLMYHADRKIKIYLREGEAQKVARAITNGGPSMEYFHQNGGNFSECVVGEMESLLSLDDTSVKESCVKCSSGQFSRGCAEHKEQVSVLMAKRLGVFE